MTHPRPTIPVRYARELLAFLPRETIAALLAGERLGPEILATEGFRLTPAQIGNLYLKARRAGDDELFGYFARPVPPGSYGVLTALLTHTPRMRDALSASAAFYGLFDERHAHLELAVSGAEATLVVVPRTARQASSIFFVHAMMLSSMRTMFWLVDQAAPPHRVVLDPSFSAFASETRFLFGCQPSFAPGRFEVTFAAALLDLPITRGVEDAAVWARGSLQAILTAPPADTLESAVRRRLTQGRPLYAPSLADVAEGLGCSRATLARRLRGQGLSFQQIKDDMRRDHAVALLTREHETVEEVAEILGYAEPSSFRRAFRSWTGVSPGAFRALSGLG